MAKSKEWYDENIEQIRARLLTAYNIVDSYAIIPQYYDDGKKIDLVKYDLEHGLSVIKCSIISYEEMISASTTEQRIELLLDAVRDYDFMFYIDGRLVKLILEG